MLANRNAVANLAVKDLNVAEKFYEQTLGLREVSREGAEVITYKSGNSLINVYRSEFAGTNKATAVTWAVDNVAEEVKQLKGKGIRFEHYDIPGLERTGDIHSGGDMQVAWFKDPDGNILSLIEEK